MNREIVEQVVQAVLYEGYILYPYRASSKKNRQRFTFGRVYPQAYAAAQGGREPCLMQTQCLVRDESRDARMHIEVRFLHPMARDVVSGGKLVSEVRLGGMRYQSWQEAVERSVQVPEFSLGKNCRHSHAFEFPANEAREALDETAFLVRRQEALRGRIEIAVEPLDALVSRLTVQIRNESAVPEAELEDQDGIVLRTFASAHTIIWAEGGRCFSLLDPPGGYEEAAKNCQNICTWPVLVGEETKGEHDTLLSSPIILYDYPKIAPESQGDLYDGLEIDEILTLRIQTMTEEEKAEMRATDEHARRILERTEAMPGDHLLQMHGVMKSVDPATEAFFNPHAKRVAVTVQGVELKAGDRVRIRPKRRADAFDMMLAGKVGIIEAIEEDVDDMVQLALVLEDDPGRELGMARQPGHRFFYGADEVEPLSA